MPPSPGVIWERKLAQLFHSTQCFYLCFMLLLTRTNWTKILPLLKPGETCHGLQWAQDYNSRYFQVSTAQSARASSQSPRQIGLQFPRPNLTDLTDGSLKSLIYFFELSNFQNNTACRSHWCTFFLEFQILALTRCVSILLRPCLYSLQSDSQYSGYAFKMTSHTVQSWYHFFEPKFPFTVLYHFL